MTKYEQPRVLGVRAEQINAGSPVLVTLTERDTDPVKIALRELKVFVFFLEKNKKFFFKGRETELNYSSSFARWIN